MRSKLALKTLFRSPVRTILTFILLFAVTFAMFSQVMEYAIANREMKKAVEQYDGALSIQSARAPNSDASNPRYMYADPRASVDELPQFFAEGFRRLKSIPISDHIMEQVSALPYISYIDKRYMTAGYSDTYTRVDDGRDYYNYTNQCVIEATVTHKYIERITVQDTRAEINGQVCRTYVTSNPDKCMNEPLDITWLEGYDASSMMQLEEHVVVVGEVIANSLEIAPGDTVRITKAFVYQRIYDNYFYKYSKEFGDPPLRYIDEQYNPEYDVWYNGFNEKYGANIDEEYAADTDEFKVIGIATARTHSPDLSIFINGTLDLNILYGKLAILDVIEATLIDNWKAEEYRAFGEELADANRTYEVAFIMDSTEVEHIANNIAVLELLYPVAVIAMLVIGVFMTSLIIVQTSKDIAIMRVLGTSKRRTRAIIVLERVLLCLAGMILAAVIMFAMRGITAAVARKIVFILAAYFAAVTASSVIASIASTRKNVLELLQTKE